MIFLGLDPGTSDNMALAALLPEGTTPNGLRVAVAEPGDGEILDRAVKMRAALREKFWRMALPDGHKVTMALEWQRPLKTDKRPQNICDLSAFAGIALATIQAEAEILRIDHAAVSVYTPLPEEWKGQVLKHIKHNRIVREAGGPEVVSLALQRSNIPVPKNLGAFTKEFTGLAGNVIDAIGLALWARERTLLRERIERATMPRS